MCDSYEEVTDIEMMETLKEAARTRKPANKK